MPTRLNRVGQVTLIIPYYRSPLMLEEQLKVVIWYPVKFRTVVVDDCSPEPASEVFDRFFKGRDQEARDYGDLIKLYRIEDALEWNREGARNLGATVAETEWIMQIDTDHVLPAVCAKRLLETEVSARHWYWFTRYRVGQADETRRKDAIPDEQKYGQIKPHLDSYLCTKAMYWKNGGYNEDYVGCLGGGGPFLKRMRMVGGEPVLLPDNIRLEVHTRHSVPDASVRDLSRDKAEFKRRRVKIGTEKPKNPLRFKWSRVR